MKTGAAAGVVGLEREFCAGEAYREHGPYVFRVVRRMGIAAKDVEDVVHDTFVIAHRKRETYNGKCAVRTWLYGIAIRVASDHRRRAYVRRVNLNPQLIESASETGQQDSQAHASQLRALLDEGLAQLSDEQREVFVLREIEQVSMVEIAELQDCHVQTVYSRLYAARKLVRAHVEHAIQGADKKGASAL